MTLREVTVGAAPLERFRGVLTGDQWEALSDAAERAREVFAGRSVWSVNSTARGGGVAELLGSLIPYSRGAGVDARWAVIAGDERFFRTTKRIHNLLHGSPGDGVGLTGDDAASYAATSDANARELAAIVKPGDLVLLHDPQTAGLAGPLRRHGARVVWRCHVGADRVDENVRLAWDFLRPHVDEAERLVFSRLPFVWEGIDPARVVAIAPSIDPFGPKNQPLADHAVAGILAAADVQPGGELGEATFTRVDASPSRVARAADLNGSSPLDPADPVVLQVSRWDRLKDPAGVLAAFRDGIAPATGAHLVLAAPSTAAVTDDPEGAEVLDELRALRAGLPPELTGRVHLLSLPMDDLEENAAIVNALQRRADVVVQKSLAEGFGLTVAEAMWKARPVVASDVGGIGDQIVDGESGVLVDPDDLDHFAAAVVQLLTDSGRARLMGHNARERVRGAFLGSRHLEQYLDLFQSLLSSGHPTALPRGSTTSQSPPNSSTS